MVVVVMMKKSSNGYKFDCSHVFKVLNVSLCMLTELMVIVMMAVLVVVMVMEVVVMMVMMMLVVMVISYHLGWPG